jgi:hypothetical protein
MFFSSKKKAPHCLECMILQCVVAFFLFCAFVASGIGVYLAHVTQQGVVFGTVGGSLAILAFVGSLLAFMKQLKYCMMPCDVCTVETTKKK